MQAPTEEKKRLHLLLCSNIRGIDTEAAIWVYNEAPKMRSFQYTDDLLDAFTWNESPQGADFWCDIQIKMQNKNRVNTPTTSQPAAPPVELWWQRERREQHAQREEIFALRNAIRKICGQEHY